MKINLKDIKKIDQNDLLKRIEYRYSIGDSSGLLKIEQTMYNKSDELYYFIEIIIPNLYKYKDKVTYYIYYKNYKYTYNEISKGSCVSSVKMY